MLAAVPSRYPFMVRSGAILVWIVGNVFPVVVGPNSLLECRLFCVIIQIRAICHIQFLRLDRHESESDSEWKHAARYRVELRWRNTHEVPHLCRYVIISHVSFQYHSHDMNGGLLRALR
jgi:hypothetical protein